MADEPVLAERESELVAIEQALAAARDAAGAVLVVEGAAGMGKTTLLAAARSRAAEAGMTVLHGRGTELEREYPLGVARQCLERAVRREEDRARLLRGAARLVAPVLLDVPKPLEATPVGILHGLYWLVAALADEAPVLLVVDDAQWTDEPSLRFLAYVCRRAASLHLALIVGARPTEPADGAAGMVLDALRADPVTRRLELRALDSAGVGQILEAECRAPVAPAFALACREATGGNPFLVGELARALRAQGTRLTAAETAQVPDIAPPTVTRATAATLARLGPTAAALARAASVLGDGGALELAAALADVPIDGAPAAAAALVHAGVLADASPLRFRHPILAGAVRAGVSAPERAAIHARAADLLRIRGAPPERLAPHLLHASPARDQRVVRELRLAAAHARERGAPATAVAMLRRALDEPPLAARAELLVDLARVELATGGTARAVEHLEEARRVTDDPRTRAEALSALMQANPGDPVFRRRAAELAHEALPELASLEPELALRLRAALLLAGAASPDLSPLTGRTPAEAVLLGTSVFLRMTPHATAAEIADLAGRAARQADALAREGAVTIAFSGVVLGLRWADELDEAQRAVEVAIAIARERGSTFDFASALTLRASVHRRAGRLLEAEADARGASAAVMDPAWAFARGLAPLVTTLVEQGRAADAQAVLDASPVGADVPDSPPMLPVLLARMWVRAARRHHDDALADWRLAASRVERLRPLNAGWIEDLSVLVDIEWARGDRVSARAAADQAHVLAERWATPGAMGEALHAQARAGAGDAIDRLHRAVELLATSPARLAHAKALVTLGGHLRRAGARADSRAPLREGYELARRCGAAVLAETARAELRASGIRLRREALTGADALTASERRIAGLAAEGRSNAEIAQELFLTVKTVEMHLTNAFRKLDVRGRGELGGALGGRP